MNVKDQINREMLINNIMYISNLVTPYTPYTLILGSINNRVKAILP